MAICLRVLRASPECFHHAVSKSYAYISDVIVHLIEIEERGHTLTVVFPGGTEAFKLTADKLA